MASGRGLTEVVKILVEHGANVNGMRKDMFGDMVGVTYGGNDVKFFD